jgi:hypothetical protein
MEFAYRTDDEKFSKCSVKNVKIRLDFVSAQALALLLRANFVCNHVASFAESLEEIMVLVSRVREIFLTTSAFFQCIE